MRVLTAGESHGECIVAILEGFPKGVKISSKSVNQDLKQRMSGAGRGKRMCIEDDTVSLVSGLRNKVSLGSPIAMLVKNRDVLIFAQANDRLPPLTIPRPSHADLAGALKYQDKDLRNILERASARETVARVCVGAICRQFLLSFGIRIGSFTVSVGGVVSNEIPSSVQDIEGKARSSSLHCIDKAKERIMVKEIQDCEKKNNTLGGVIEVWADGVPAGLGSFMHFDRRLDAKLSYLLMSIPAVKGVEVGLGFEYARKTGYSSHDSIYHNKKRGFYRKTNNSGGIEGGVSNGEPLVLRLAMKPIATLRKPLDSVDLITKRTKKASVIRSDVCAIVACGVIAESMSAIAITESFLEKFGCDSLKEIKSNYKNYLSSINKIG